MSVNPSELELFSVLAQQVSQNDVDAMVAPTLKELKESANVFLRYTGPAADVSFEDKHVPGRDGYQIPIRVYNPQLDASKPVFIMYPGCGFVLDLFEVNAIAASRIAMYGEIKVIIVNFRLCPEVALPVPIHDAYDATKYIASHSEVFNIDPNNIYIGGMSSGAHAAANVGSMSRSDDALSIKKQILLNGAYDLTQSQHGYDEYEAQDKICQRGPGIDFMFEQYEISKQDFARSPFSPLFEKDVSAMPDTTFLIAEYDGLRNDSEAYYQHLKSQNKNIERVILPGQTHNTIILCGAMTDGDDPAQTIANIITKN
jgi:acetyl esterase